MTRFTVTSDDRRELERARSILSKHYVIRQEKTPQTGESQRFRLYLFVIPKEENAAGIEKKPIKYGGKKERRTP
ncbi:MAG: hypothetical protein IKN81_10455 [Oscillospiraceae bacterium]|nr:hypothetical protein [Oscillospiraceae bacterium]